MPQNQLSLQQILQKLSPIQSGMDTLWGIFLYLIFFLTLICFFAQKKPVMATTMMLAASMIMMIIDKVAVGPGLVLPSTDRNDPNMIFTFFMRVAMFSLPLVAVSQSKTPKSRKWGIMAFVVGFVYFVVRGFVDFKFLGGK